MTRPAHSPQRDAAWGKFYAKRGLTLTRSDRVPTTTERLINWMARYLPLRAMQ
jgi:hypothetical protein